MTYIDYLFVFGLFGIFAAANYLQNKAMYNSQKDADLADLRKQKDELEVNLHRDDKKYITPIRLQAYERAVLFLERISPQSMIFRIQMPGMNVLNLQTAMLQNIRDEAHRFAVSYHRLVRSKKVVRSVLDEIPGIGPKTKKALLDHFGSLDNIRKANSEDMEKIIGKDKAKILMENL